MDTNKIKKPRPYWHVDAKWLTGMFLLLLLNITFLLFLLVQVTAPEQGITLLTNTMASSFSFSGGGLDSANDLEIMHQKIAESPNGAWQPIPGLNITVREEDIAGKTPREMRLWFFRQMAEPLYYQGPQGLVNLSSDPEIQKGFEGGVGPLGVISAATHSKLMIALAVSGLVSIIFLGLLIFFSYRFGRLGSPGCIIFMAAIPGLLLLSGARGWLENAAQNPAPTETTVITRYTQLAADVLPTILQKAMVNYVILIFFGLGLMLVALIGAMFVRERKNKEAVK
jgi:hypothetical protein